MDGISTLDWLVDGWMEGWMAPKIRTHMGGNGKRLLQKGHQTSCHLLMLGYKHSELA